jgi:hypothetical protein
MTGPEHYHEAERLMTEIDPQWQADYITANTRKAQVHAILALAAATALHGVTDHQHWFEVAGAGHAHG